MVEHSKGNEKPPPELELALLCEQYGALPNQILNEDYGRLKRMSVLKSTYRLATKIPTLTGNKINTHLSDSERLFWSWLDKQGVM